MGRLFLLPYTHLLLSEILPDFFTKNSAMHRLIQLYTRLFVRKAFYPLHLFLFKLSLKGMGFFNYENEGVSGERAFIRYLRAGKRLAEGGILDIGAHTGDYSVMLRKNQVELPVYAFEPHPKTFRTLATVAAQYNVTPVQMGMGAVSRTAHLYDYAAAEGSQHASLYEGVIGELRHSAVQETPISLTTVDEFIDSEGISHVALLKIDTEGSEKAVLEGAREAIRGGRIGAIQVEFNEMNVISRTFLRDILDLLPGYNFYRLLPDGLQPLGEYKAPYFEIFAFQNIVALRA